MQTILKIYANVFEIIEEIFKGDWSCIVPVTIELKTNTLGGQKDKGHPRNINQKVQKHKYMNNHERVIFQNCQRCERFIEKIGIEHKTLENTNLGLRKRREKKSILRIRGEQRRVIQTCKEKIRIYIYFFFLGEQLFKIFFHFFLWEEKEKPVVQKTSQNNCSQIFIKRGLSLDH